MYLLRKLSVVSGVLSRACTLHSGFMRERTIARRLLARLKPRPKLSGLVSSESERRPRGGASETPSDVSTPLVQARACAGLRIAQARPAPSVHFGATSGGLTTPVSTWQIHIFERQTAVSSVSLQYLRFLPPKIDHDPGSASIAHTRLQAYQEEYMARSS